MDVGNIHFFNIFVPAQILHLGFHLKVNLIALLPSGRDHEQTDFIRILSFQRFWTACPELPVA